MPRGPNGERRPADAIGCAITVAKIATGEFVENLSPSSGRVRSGRAGAEARMRSTTPSQRKDIAKKAAAIRWK
jgi:hypothetical protein